MLMIMRQLSVLQNLKSLLMILEKTEAKRGKRLTVRELRNCRWQRSCGLPEPPEKLVFKGLSQK